jgi:hypothetical protein
MVYNKIYIVSGVKVSSADIKQLLIDEEYLDPDLETDEDEKFVIEAAWEKYEEDNHSTLFGTDLHQAPCCSECKDYILGRIVHTIYRRHVSCRKCEEYSACANCFGQTVYGWYNIDNIFSTMVEVPPEKHCVYCNSDQVNDSKRCQLCYKDQVQLQVRSGRKEKVGLEKLVGQALNNPSYFYLMDDCTSCT